MTSTDAILEFRGPHAFLSNFYIEPDGTFVERNYQQAKCLRDEDWDKFNSLTPGECKRLGHTIELRPDWEEVKISIMEELLHVKFTDHPSLMEKLQATGSAELVEGNWWKDTFWGRHNGVGENHLGKLLMSVREAYR
jgi:ribA/ribD-fused uncharacterized protein